MARNHEVVQATYLVTKPCGPSHAAEFDPSAFMLLFDLLDPNYEKQLAQLLDTCNVIINVARISRCRR